MKPEENLLSVKTQHHIDVKKAFSLLMIMIMTIMMMVTMIMMMEFFGSSTRTK